MDDDVNIPFPHHQAGWSDDPDGRTLQYPCPCDECTRPKEAARQIDDLVSNEKDECSKAIADAQRAIWRARKTLHTRHKPELYPGMERVLASERYDMRFQGTGLYDRMYVHEYREFDDQSEVGGCADSLQQYISEDDIEHQDRYYGKFSLAITAAATAFPALKQRSAIDTKEASHPASTSGVQIARLVLCKEDCSNPECRYAYPDYLTPSERDESLTFENYVIYDGGLEAIYSMDGFRNCGGQTLV